MEGVVYYDVKYILEVDFANDVVAVKDAYLQYQGVKIGDTPLYFRAGNFRTPNSFELLTSELFVDTLERAAFVNAWQLDRQIGFQVSYWHDHWGLAAGIFGDRFNAANNPQPLFPGFTGDEDVTFAARATVAPINRQVNGVNQVLHFGASVRTREIGDDQPLLQYTQRGADFNLANNAVNTGRIGKEDTFWGLEAATLWGPFSLQGEYAHLDVDLPNSALIPPIRRAGTAEHRRQSVHQPLDRRTHARSRIQRLVCHGHLVLRRPQDLQQRGQVGPSDDRQPAALE